MGLKKRYRRFSKNKPMPEWHMKPKPMCNPGRLLSYLLFTKSIAML